MFGKTRGSDGRPPLPSDGGENPWDVSSIARICKAEKLGVRILHVEKNYRDGAFAPGNEHKFGETSIIGTGEIPDFPQHAHVDVTFQKEMNDYGVIVLNYQYNMNHQGRSVNMPVVNIVLRDQDGQAAEAMHDAMRDALLSGLDSVDLRCWINFVPGWDLRESVIYGKITGAQIWSQLHTPKLPTWSMPIGVGDLNEYPDPSRLRAAPNK